MHRFLFAAACTLILVGGAGHARAADYTFTTIDVPRANPYSADSSTPLGTAIGGINDLGQIVGASRFLVAPPVRDSVAYGLALGFLDTSGTITPVEPGSLQFTPSSINSVGQIVASGSIEINGILYESSGLVQTRGVLAQEAIDVPGPISSINDLGTAVGVTGNNGPGGETQTGFLYTGGHNTPGLFYGISTTVFGSGQSSPLPFGAVGINDAGQVVGVKNTANLTYLNSQGVVYPYYVTSYQGVLDSGGVITNIDAPGAVPGTTLPTGISNIGEIVGNYKDALGNSHVFVDANGSYSSFDVPGAVAPDSYGHFTTQATGINSAGDVVGDYYTIVNGNYFEHGFLATPTAVPEPGSATLLGMGLAALGLTARRRTSA